MIHTFNQAISDTHDTSVIFVTPIVWL